MRHFGDPSDEHHPPRKPPRLTYRERQVVAAHLLGYTRHHMARAWRTTEGRIRTILNRAKAKGAL